MAIAVFCNDRELFEETVRYAVNGCGNGSIPHMIVYPTGQCQETTRAQHYVQLGIGLLTGAAEVAWQQGVDLYGWNDNLILKGHEYTAKYGLGEDVPYQHYLDRTGKYGSAGATTNTPRFPPRAAGTFGRSLSGRTSTTPSAGAWPRLTPAGLLNKNVRRAKPRPPRAGDAGSLQAEDCRDKAGPCPGCAVRPCGANDGDGDTIDVGKSVDPVNAIDASGYSVFRSEQPGGAAQKIADGLAKPEYHDTSVERGGLYFYTVKASNKVGTSRRR